MEIIPEIYEMLGESLDKSILSNVKEFVGFPNEWILKSKNKGIMSAGDISMLGDMIDQAKDITMLSLKHLNTLCYLFNEPGVKVQDGVKAKISDCIRDCLNRNSITSAPIENFELETNYAEGFGTGAVNVSYIDSFPVVEDSTAARVIITLLKKGKEITKIMASKVITMSLNDKYVQNYTLSIYMPKLNDEKVKEDTITYARVMRAWGKSLGRFAVEKSIKDKTVDINALTKFLTPIGLNAGAAGLLEKYNDNKHELANIIAFCLPKFKEESFHGFGKQTHMNLIAFAMVIDSITAKQRNLDVTQAPKTIQFAVMHLNRAKANGFDESNINSDEFTTIIRCLACKIKTIGGIGNDTAGVYANVFKYLNYYQNETYKPMAVEQNIIDDMLNSIAIGRKNNKN